jgi:pimeloyl-ACP methyl ester carboxylesterase
LRHRALRDNAVHGERVSARDVVELADDLLHCDIRDALLASTAQLAPFDPLPCPVTLAWGEFDRVLPPGRNGRRARALMPSAEWRDLPDVGHAPMLDDPGLVAEVILATTGATARGSIKQTWTVSWG